MFLKLYSCQLHSFRRLKHRNMNLALLTVEFIKDMHSELRQSSKILFSEIVNKSDLLSCNRLYPTNEALGIQT